jgi:hypothetical protein
MSPQVNTNPEIAAVVAEMREAASAGDGRRRTPRMIRQWAARLESAKGEVQGVGLSEGERRQLKPGEVFVEVDASNHGTFSLTVGDGELAERIAGPKAWGGSRAIHSFVVKADVLARVAKEYEVQP